MLKSLPIPQPASLYRQCPKAFLSASRPWLGTYGRRCNAGEVIPAGIERDHVELVFRQIAVGILIRVPHRAPPPQPAGMGSTGITSTASPGKTAKWGWFSNIFAAAAWLS